MDLIRQHLFWWSFLELVRQGDCLPEKLKMGNQLQDNSQLYEQIRNASFVVGFNPYIMTERIESNVSSLVELFASRFNEMSTYVNSKSIFDIVALHNMKVINTNTGEPIKIFAKQGLYQSFESDLETLTAEIDSVNEAFQQYMTSIILTNFDYTDTLMVLKVKKLVTNLQSRSNRTTPYRIGIEVNSKCGLKGSTDVLIATGVDIVIFNLEWKYSYLINGVKNTVNHIGWRIAYCKRIFWHNNQKLEIAFATTWVDTDSGGTSRNQSALVDFWQQMASVSQSLNVRIFMDQAFDESSSHYSKMDSNGWWTVDLAEKAVLPNNNIETHLDKRAITSVCNFDSPINFLKVSSHQNSIVNFNTDLISAFFHYQFLTTQHFSVYQYAAFGQLISRRFRRILLVSLGINKDLVQSPTGIDFMRGVAVRNKIASDCHGKEFKTLELTAGLSFDTSNNRLNNVNRFSSLLQTIVDVNEIFNGTVTSVLLLFYAYWGMGTIWSEISKEFRTIQRTAQNKSIKVGLEIQARHLDDRSYFENLQHYVIPHVDFVYLSFEICEDPVLGDILQNKHGFEKVINFVFETHERLSSGFKNIHGTGNLIPGILLDLEGTKCDKLNKTHSDFGRVWYEASKLADERKIRLILGPGIGEYHGDTAEWWKVVSTGIHYSVEEPNFEFPQQTTSNSCHNAWAIGVSVFFAVILIGGTLFYCRIIRKRTRTVDSNGTEELQELNNGQRIFPQSGPEWTLNVVQDLAKMVYDSSMEIEEESFLIESSISLGSGQFGSVCLAKISKYNGADWTAAKFLNCNDICETESLRSLLIEIKVLSYLGKHDNIVQLVGTYTTNITSGKVYAFLELCHLGSLHGYLRWNPNKSNYISHEESKYMCYPDKFERPTEDEMLKWAVDISRGMDYISSKHIVHADLATRNVLLDINKTAKICDFGLSRRMENYSNYIKSKQEPLPWRWMAYESLTHMEFSSKSDVWSYGVTLWELYNEGQVPYQGLSWTCNFAEALKSGLRPPQTKRLCENIYSLMTRCWAIQPVERPDFATIYGILTTQKMEFFEKEVNIDNNKGCNAFSDSTKRVEDNTRELTSNSDTSCFVADTIVKIPV